MPIVPPQLDDLRFDLLVEELIRRIPVHAPEWTDHNESDPGITLIQLFGYVAEQVGYRLNRIPEKNHVELLKLLGVRLKTARAARTQLAFLLSNSASVDGFLLSAGARAKATEGDPPPIFETDVDVDIVPAEPAVLLTTSGERVWNLLHGQPEPTEDQLENQVSPEASPWHALAWDGDKPKLKDWPLEPIVGFPDTSQQYLWVGLKFNDALDAGFRGVRVTLTVQFDDDEQPDLEGVEECAVPVSIEDAPPTVEWLYYFDEDTQDAERIPGRIDDTTLRLTRSGTIRFTIPFSIGPIPESMFADLRAEIEVSPGQACEGLRGSLAEQLGPAQDPKLDPNAPNYLSDLQSALTAAVDEAFDDEAEAKPAIPHPLDPALRDPNKVTGWLRIGPLNLATDAESPKLRVLTFNAVQATNAETVTSELLGQADGRPGQTFQLVHRNVLAGTLEVAVQEEVDGLLVPWARVDSLDGSGPFDRHVQVDLEAGTLLFGNGTRGMIPALAPGAGHVIATRYRHGGGVSGEVGTGAITSLETQYAGIAGVVNFVTAAGGADAETLEAAKIRARKELSTRNRAVTEGDFQWITLQTPNVRVARVEVVPLRRPLTSVNGTNGVANVKCGGELPGGPSGLDGSFVAHGAVSVVVAPDEEGPEPIPTPSFLRAVCEHLNKHRLVTTEVYVVPPQYARLCNFRVQVRAEPGYSRAQLQDLVEAKLATYLHVLSGGEDGTGFPFGGQMHVADLIAQVFSTEGIERVEDLSCDFSRTKSNADLRQGSLVLCPALDATDERDSIDLAPEETVSIDLTEFTLTTVA